MQWALLASSYSILILSLTVQRYLCIKEENNIEKQLSLWKQYLNFILILFNMKSIMKLLSNDWSYSHAMQKQ